MSGTLSPGTRIPSLMPSINLTVPPHVEGYYRGLLEGLVLGGTAGLILGLMCAALAWSHLG